MGGESCVTGSSGSLEEVIKQERKYEINVTFRQEMMVYNMVYEWGQV